MSTRKDLIQDIRKKLDEAELDETIGVYAIFDTKDTVVVSIDFTRANPSSLLKVSQVLTHILHSVISTAGEKLFDNTGGTTH